MLFGYKHILVDTYGFSRGLSAAQFYGADIGSLLQASEESWLWGWVHAVAKPEGELFPGPTIALLAVFVVVAARPFAGSRDGTRTQIRIRRTFAVLAIILLAATLMPILVWARGT